jgi:hypothetical protein
MASQSGPSADGQTDAAPPEPALLFLCGSRVE